MVGDDPQIGKSTREVCKLHDLGMIERHVVGEAHAVEHGDPFAKRLVGQ